MVVPDQIAECHRLMNEAGVPGNHESGDGIVGRVRFILDRLKTADRILNSGGARLYELENENEHLRAAVSASDRAT